MTTQFRDFAGLWLDPNPHSKVPEGACELFTNVEVSDLGLVKGRRGFHEQTLDEDIAEGGPIEQTFVDPDTGEVIFTGRTETRRSGNGTEIVSPLGSVTLPLFSASVSREALFLASDIGVTYLRSANSAQRIGFETDGIAMINTGISFLTTGTVWLPDTHAVAYRATVEKVRGNGRRIVSAPMPRVVLTSDAGAPSAVQFDLKYSDDIYADILPGDQIKVFRSFSVATGVPSDEMFLVGAITIVTAQTQYTFTDRVDNPQLGEPLYTNPTQETIAMRNVRPPLTKALATYQASLFAGNVVGDWEQPISWVHDVSSIVSGDVDGIGTRQYTATCTNGSPTLTAVSDTSGLQIGQVIVGLLIPPGSVITAVNSGASTVTMNANATGTDTTIFLFHDAIHIRYNDPAVTTAFMVFANPLAFWSIGNKIRANLGNLTNLANDADVSVLNLADIAPSNGSTGSTMPSYAGVARFNLVVGAKLGNVAFDTAPQVWATHGNEMIPPLPLVPLNLATPGLAMTRRIDPALMFWSKKGQPDHFATPQQAYIGDTDAPIYGAIAASNVLYVFKQEGIFTITGAGATSGFRVDLTHRAMTSRHMCEANGAAACWTDRGIIMIHPGGQIENITDGRLETFFRDNIRPEVDPLEYEGNMVFDRRNAELVFTIHRNAQDLSGTCFVFNTRTKTWAAREVHVESILLSTPMDADQGGAEHIGMINFGAENVFTLWAPPLDADIDEPWQKFTDYGFDPVVITEIFEDDSRQEDRDIAVVVFTHEGIFDDIEIGDAFAQENGTVVAHVIDVIEIGDGFSVVTVVYSTDEQIQPGAAELWFAIQNEVRLRQNVDTDIGAYKRWTSLHYTFEGPPLRLGRALLSTTSSNRGGEQSVIKRLPEYFLDATQPSSVIRMLINGSHAHASHIHPALFIKEAGAQWRLSGITIDGTPISRDVIS